MTAPRPNLLRQLSEQAILEAIFHEGPITRPEIAARTGISKPTVSAVVSRLVQGHLVQPVGERTGRRGRAPVAFTVNSAAGFVVGVDVGSTVLRVAAADIYGEVALERELPAATDGARDLDRRLTAEIREVERELEGELLAIGVSTPGVVDPATRRVTSLAYHVSASGAYDALAGLERRFGVPVLVENDVNSAAVGEKWHGLARGVPTFVFVSLGAGVGMGVVIEHELYRGYRGAAGEIAYLPLTPDPFDERHRRLGGLEDEVGAGGLLEAYNREAATAAESAREVFARATAGDIEALAVVERTARQLGLAIATVCAVIDPELVVLGGRIGGSPDLLPPVRAAVARLLPLPTRIETSVLAERAALEGALAMGLRAARERLFSGSF
ncbi:MAG TPA: ROK family transcriptional regulator [Solirubrobacteraceae bacterium]|nr:ROK family transcriptional regulator [Solirubrobacteraceae bacterium]